MDRDFSLLDANGMVLGGGARNPEDAIGRPLWELFTGADHLKVAIARARSGEAVKAVDYSIVPVFGSDGKVAYLVAEVLAPVAWYDRS